MDLKTKIVCINLQECIDRKEKIKNQLKDISIPYEFFKAVDFKNIKLISKYKYCSCKPVSKWFTRQTRPVLDRFHDSSKVNALC